MCGRSSSASERNSAMSIRLSTRSTTTPASVTAGPSHSAAAKEEADAAAARKRQRRWRFYRSLSAKATLIAVIFLAVPIIVYSQFRAADEAAEALLLQNVREQ